MTLPSVDSGFADRLGIRVERVSPTLDDCGCGAVAAVSPSGTAADGEPAAPGTAADGESAATVPTGIVLALVDATARAAAEAAVTVPGRRTTLVATATGVQFREAARGTVTARASVPCEGVITDRADERGLFRFSVAVEVADPAGIRVANGTVQWLAQIADDPADGDADGDPVDGGAPDEATGGTAPTGDPDG